jgi:hypothetical protein
MDTYAIEHVCILRNAPGSRDLAFDHALDWASGLKVPLQILTLPSEAAGVPNGIVPAPIHEESASAWTERGTTCEEISYTDASCLAAQLFRPHGLSVFSESLPPKIKNRLLDSSLHVRQSAILVCSGSWPPVSRVLIVHARFDGEDGFLDSAVPLCRLFQAAPVILTVARTESKARQGQRIAEEACLVHRIPAHLDYVVGLDVRLAVASIARWRRCSHVFLARRQAIPWWSWMRGDTLKELLDSADSLTFLALPESGFRLRAGAAPSQENFEHLVTP